MTEPESPLAQAQALIDAHLNADAVRLLQRHLERSPADPAANYLLGLAAYGSEDDDLAVAAFTRCLGADPGNALAQFGLEISLRQQQASEAAPQPPEPRPIPEPGDEPASRPLDHQEPKRYGSPFHRRPRLLALAVGLVLALTVVVVALIIRQPEPEPTRFSPIQVGHAPDGVAVARSVVWVASRDGTVTRINPDQPSTSRVPLGIGKNLDSVAIGGGSVWVTDEDQSKVARLDESSGSVQDVIEVRGRPKGLTVGGGSVWVANCRGTVIRIPLEPGSRPRPIRVEGRPRSVAVALGRVYVAVRPKYDGCGSAPGAFGHIAILDVSGAKPPQVLLPIGDPSDVAFTNGSLWVADQSRNRVLRVDPDTGAIQGEPLAVDNTLTALAANEGGVWALSRSPKPTTDDIGTVTRIDPGTGERVGNPIAVDGLPQEIAVETGRVWVTQAKTDKVTPIKP
jgi:streptogramin lyase